MDYKEKYLKYKKKYITLKEILEGGGPKRKSNMQIKKDSINVLIKNISENIIDYVITGIFITNYTKIVTNIDEYFNKYGPDDFYNSIMDSKSIMDIITKIVNKTKISDTDIDPNNFLIEYAFEKAIIFVNEIKNTHSSPDIFYIYQEYSYKLHKIYEYNYNPIIIKKKILFEHISQFLLLIMLMIFEIETISNLQDEIEELKINMNDFLTKDVFTLPIKEIISKYKKIKIKSYFLKNKITTFFFFYKTNIDIFSGIVDGYKQELIFIGYNKKIVNDTKSVTVKIDRNLNTIEEYEENFINLFDYHFADFSKYIDKNSLYPNHLEEIIKIMDHNLEIILDHRKNKEIIAEALKLDSQISSVYENIQDGEIDIAEKDFVGEFDIAEKDFVGKTGIAEQDFIGKTGIAEQDFIGKTGIAEQDFIGKTKKDFVDDITSVDLVVMGDGQVEKKDTKISNSLIIFDPYIYNLDKLKERLILREEELNNIDREFSSEQKVSGDVFSDDGYKLKLIKKIENLKKNIFNYSIDPSLMNNIPNILRFNNDKECYLFLFPRFIDDNIIVSIKTTNFILYLIDYISINQDKIKNYFIILFNKYYFNNDIIRIPANGTVPDINGYTESIKIQIRESGVYIIFLIEFIPAKIIIPCCFTLHRYNKIKKLPAILSLHYGDNTYFNKYTFDKDGPLILENENIFINNGHEVDNDNEKILLYKIIKNNEKYILYWYLKDGYNLLKNITNIQIGLYSILSIVLYTLSNIIMME
jgi:hypothetical protein